MLTLAARRSRTILALAAMLALGGGARAQGTAEVLRGQDVTIIAGEQRTIYEYRQNGVLRYVRIVPKTGRPYYLRPADPTRGSGDLERADQLLPSWVLVEF